MLEYAQNQYFLYCNNFRIKSKLTLFSLERILIPALTPDSIGENYVFIQVCCKKLILGKEPLVTLFYLYNDKVLLQN
jgi:hypothetical protein